MTLTQLRIFTAVARLGHMTRAAKALGITQSAASAAIATLEAQYDIKLFDRVGRSIQLSEAGGRFLDEAQAVLDRARAAERVLQDLGNLTVGNLEIAASQTISNYWLPRKLAAFHAKYPGITLNVAIGNTSQVEAAVVGGSADAGFVEGATRSAELLLDEVDRDELVFVTAPGQHPIADTARPRRILHDLAWVVRETGSGTRAVLDKFCEDLGFGLDELSIVLELPSNEAVRDAVEAGIGATLISKRVVAPSLTTGRLVPLPFSVPSRSFHLVRHSQRQPTAALRALTDMLLDERPKVLN